MMRLYTPAEDSEIRRLRRLGVRPSDMPPYFLGRSVKSLCNRMERLGLTADGMKRGPRRTRSEPADWMRGADDLGPFPRDDLEWTEAEWASRLAGRQFVDHGVAGA